MRKVIRVRYEGRCASCGSVLTPAMTATWDQDTKQLWCEFCGAPPEDVGTRGDQELLRSPIDRGVAGASARRQYQRRRQALVKKTMTRHPYIGGVLLKVTPEPQPTKSWVSGAVGEERVGAILDRLVGHRGVVLHDRRHSRFGANIDHILIGPSGVLVVDTKRYQGKKVESRSVGPMFRRKPTLFVGGRNRTRDVEGVLGQLADVRAVLREPDASKCAAALCFWDATWQLPGAFTIDGVRIARAKPLAKLVLSRNNLTSADVDRVARTLSAAFVSA